MLDTYALYESKSYLFWFEGNTFDVEMTIDGMLRIIEINCDDNYIRQVFAQTDKFSYFPLQRMCL